MCMLSIVLWILTLYNSRCSAASFLNESFLPEFISLPTSIIDVDSLDYPARFGCRIWPPAPLGWVSYFSATTVSRSSLAPLHPVALDLLDPSRTELVLPSADSARRLLSYELYCLANTAFGSVLSPPFRLVRKGTSSPAATVVQRVPKSGTGVVRCGQTDEVVTTSMQFTLNGTLLALIPGKHLIVPSIRTPYRVEHVLLIRDFGPSDVGSYRCLIVNRLGFGHSALDSRRTTLHLSGDASTPYDDYDDFALGSFSSQLPRFVAIEGSNISLRCPSTNPLDLGTRITLDRAPAVSSRHHFNREFGVLFIDQLRVEDGGIYRCVGTNKSASLFLHVKPKPRVHVHPAVVDPTTERPNRITCTGSEPFPPTWYHNGRVIFSQTGTRSTPNSTIHLDRLSESNLGVYQCVQRSLPAGWISDLVLVTNRSAKILRKTDFDMIPIPNFPAIRLRSQTMSTAANRSVTLTCWPPGVSSSLLMNFFPGTSPSLHDRLQLGLVLQFVRLVWSKDGVPLQLPPTSTGHQPYQFNFTITRPDDYGAYQCVVYVHLPVLFFTTHVQPPRHPPPNYDLAIDAMSPLHSNVGRTLTDADAMNLVGRQVVAFKSGAQHAGLRSYGQPVAPLLSPIQMDIGPFDFRSSKPTASPIGDNLAVNVTWPAADVGFYRLQLRHKLPMGRTWSKPVLAEGSIDECCSRDPSCCQQTRHYYFTNRLPDSLEAGNLYQFRLLFMSVSNAMPLGRSGWSVPVSFEHISPIAPVFTETKRLPDGGVLAKWKLSSSALGFSIDHFLLLYRMQVVPQSDGKIAYNPFKHVLVPGGETREYKLSNLERGKGYQLVVYGVHTPPGLDPHLAVFQGGVGGRKITSFSHEVFVEPQMVATTELPTTQSYRESIEGNGVVFNTAESNQHLFLILGALAGIMLLVMTCLIILCVCRQARKNSRTTKYSRAMNRQTNSWLVERDRSDCGKFEPPPSTFMLEQLVKSPDSTVGSHCPTATHRSTGHTSLIYSQPPPFVAPPPPGGQHTRYPTSDHMVPQQQAFLSQGAGLVPGSTHNPFPPGMKREPPSGGSVHGGTDNENDPVDSGQLNSHPPPNMQPCVAETAPYTTDPRVQLLYPAQHPTWHYVPGQYVVRPVDSVSHGATVEGAMNQHCFLSYPQYPGSYQPVTQSDLEYNPAPTGYTWNMLAMDYPRSIQDAHPEGYVDRATHRRSVSSNRRNLGSQEDVDQTGVQRRSRRRRFTTELPGAHNQLLCDAATGQPLMTSSPVRDLNHVVDADGGGFMQPCHMNASQMQRILYEGGCTFPAHDYHAAVHPDSKHQRDHYNPICNQCPHSLMVYPETPWNPPPTVPMHRHPLYDQHHNRDPPRVRDYSEYGIPNIHGSRAAQPQNTRH